MAGAGPHSLGSSLDHLEVVGGGSETPASSVLQPCSGLLDSPRTYCHGDLVVEHVNHQVQTDGLLPVYVRVSYWKLLAVSPPDLHGVALPPRPHRLPDEEEEVVTVDGSV